jgi:hypothetical protein
MAVPSPAHTISDVGLIGGGQVPRPGDVSRAHHGMLLLMNGRSAAAMSSRGWRSPRAGGHIQTISRTSSIRERWQALRDERSMFPAKGDEGPSESCPVIED